MPSMAETSVTWRSIALVGALVLAPPSSGSAQLRLEPQSDRFWVASAALVSAALVLDHASQEVALDNQSPGLDNAARWVDPLGRAQYLVPVLISAYVIPRIAGAHNFANAALRVGLGYAVADGIESVLKPVIGRRRPIAGGDPFAFRPFSNDELWHSLPSAHTVHAFAIATGVADEAQRPWLSALAFGVATIVGTQRVYTRAHWPSDVVASSVLAISASTTTTRWLRRREHRRHPERSGHPERSEGSPPSQ